MSQDSLRPSLDDADTATVPTSSLLRFLNVYPSAFFRRGSRTIDFSNKSSSPGSASPSQNDSTAPSLAVKIDVRETRLYPLSTVLIIGLISFLFGSLLRSLLTPADFVFISQDLNDLEDGRGHWREIKRLVEFKYAIGGWDFLIGIVRRH